MSAKPKPVVDRYADEEGPFISRALFDDIAGGNPSPEAIAWAMRGAERALSDPEPGVSAEEVFDRLEAKLSEIESKRGG